MHRYFIRVTRQFLPPFLLTALLFAAPFLFPEVQAQPDGSKLFQVCSACHHIGKGKFIGPDLKGVTERRDREWLIRFIRNSQEVIQSGDPYAVKLFEDYNKIPMPPNNLSDEEIDAILKYIETYDVTQVSSAATPVTTEPQAIDGKPYVFMEDTRHPWQNFKLTFLVSVILIVISLFDLFVTKAVKARFIHGVIILISLAVITEVTVLEAKALGRQQYYEPDQPVAFSHYIHAGQNRIDCKYCHTSVVSSKHAGFPSPQLCMNCHFVVRKGTHSGTAEIDKIYRAIETGRSIEWVRVHNLPDHAYFSHAQHVSIGRLDCKECHGDVALMDRIKQINNLGMGWCIECHRTREVQFRDNGFYAHYPEFRQNLQEGSKPMISVDDIGGTNCVKCHY